MYFPKDVEKTLKQFGLIKKQTWRDTPEVKLMAKLITRYNTLRYYEQK